MGYLGYLLKIDGTVLPNKYIDMSTYKATPAVRRLLHSWYDGNGYLHEVYSPHSTTLISFSTSNIFLAKKNEFLKYFTVRDHLPVEFYDDSTDAYRSDVFKIDDFAFEKIKVRSSNIIYKPVPITLTSY
jgi:hypothetical protein